MEKEKFSVTPWNVSGAVDYDRLVSHFGVEKITPDLVKREKGRRDRKKRNGICDIRQSSRKGGEGERGGDQGNGSASGMRSVSYSDHPRDDGEEESFGSRIIASFPETLYNHISI
jgi:hypothetical protein